MTDNGRRLLMDEQPVEAYLVNNLLPATTPGSTGELGAMMAALGVSVVESRGFIERVQALAANTALAAAPALLTMIGDVQESRLRGLQLQLSTLPQYRVGGLVTVPYISRDRVLEIVQATMNSRPKL